MRSQGRYATWRTQASPWPLLGLFLIALFLGHDTLMALEGAAAPHAAASAQHADAPDSMKDVLEPNSSAAAPQHPENCDVGFAAILRRGEDITAFALGLMPAGLALLPSPSSFPHNAVIVWQAPHWPPGKRRAQIQVYRI